jgi:hypothetical protein
MVTLVSFDRQTGVTHLGDVYAVQSHLHKDVHHTPVAFLSLRHEKLDQCFFIRLSDRGLQGRPTGVVLFNGEHTLILLAPPTRKFLLLFEKDGELHQAETFPVEKRLVLYLVDLLRLQEFD